MKRKLLIFITLLPIIGIAQEAGKFGIQFKGFVKNDFFYDTRQTISAREGHFHLYPAKEDLDVNGEDANANPNFNMLAIQSRLTGVISGPDAFGAKTSGLLEGAFFGHSNADINGFRLRHAFAKFKWDNTEFLAGQTWHPMFVTQCFPGTISFNTGVPFQPFSRNPQLRLTQHFGPINLVVAALSQRDFTSPGGSSDLRNSGVPDMQLQMHFNPSESFIAGVGGGYKMLKPRLKTDSNYVTDQVVTGISGLAFMKLKTAPVTFKVEGIYGQNLFDLLMIGGYAYEFTEDQDIIGHNNYEYTTLDNLTGWVDIHTNGKKVQAGLFAGYTKNMGSTENLMNWDPNAGMMFARGNTLDYVYRVSPRVLFNSGKARFALETEYTTAAYGNQLNSLAEVQEQSDEYPGAEITEVSNLRVLFAVYYFF